MVLFGVDLLEFFQPNACGIMVVRNGHLGHNVFQPMSLLPCPRFIGSITVKISVFRGSFVQDNFGVESSIEINRFVTFVRVLALAVISFKSGHGLT